MFPSYPSQRHVDVACAPCLYAFLVDGRGPSRRGIRTFLKTVRTSTRSARALACNKFTRFVCSKFIYLTDNDNNGDHDSSEMMMMVVVVGDDVLTVAHSPEI